MDYVLVPRHLFDRALVILRWHRENEMANELMLSDFGAQPPCPEPGYCSIHKTGHPHSVMGQEYVE